MEPYDATTPEMPFELHLASSDNAIVINDEIKDSLNNKLGKIKDSGLSQLEKYIAAKLSHRELWEVAKIDMEFNRQNMAFEDMHVSQEIIADTIIKHYNGLLEDIEGFVKK